MKELSHEYLELISGGGDPVANAWGTNGTKTGGNGVASDSTGNGNTPNGAGALANSQVWGS